MQRDEEEVRRGWFQQEQASLSRDSSSAPHNRMCPPPPFSCELIPRIKCERLHSNGVLRKRLRAKIERLGIQRSDTPRRIPATERTRVPRHLVGPNLTCGRRGSVVIKGCLGFRRVHWCFNDNLEPATSYIPRDVREYNM